METTYYTVTRREIIVSGGRIAKAAGSTAEHQVVCVRRRGESQRSSGNVIDLAAWKSAQEPAVADYTSPSTEAPAEAGTNQPAAARSRRRGCQNVLIGGELLATVSVIGTMALLMARMVFF